MSTTSSGCPIYSLLPAVFRTRDALQGGQLAALFSVLETQYGIVQDSLAQLYDDQFIETCAPWVIPYIGELIGFDPVYTIALNSPDSRAEVANTIGYRRRRGTLLALEQVTHDVSGRTTMVVEEFRRLITTLSLRDVRPHHNATARLRKGRDWDGSSVQDGPFTQLNRTIDVRRIAPRVRIARSPDPAPLDIILHGGGRFNIPDVAVWIWRWQSWPIADAPAFELGSGGYFFSALGGPAPLFQQPPPAPLPFTRLINEGDAPQPISRRSFAENIAAYYPSSFALFADGALVDASQIISANLCTNAGGALCTVPSGKIAIDPELGRIQYAADVPLPLSLRVNYSYGAAAAMGGGPYDRTTSIVPPASATFEAVVGSADYPTLEDAVAAWNTQPAGSSGIILLPGYESFAIDLTGANTVQVASGSQLLIASAEISSGSAPLFTRSCVTLRGDIEVNGITPPVLPDGQAAPLGQLQMNGIHLAGEMRVSGAPFCLQIADSTLVPGRSLTTQGNPAYAGEPSISGDAIGLFLCLTRTISGPVALGTSCSARIVSSILDASSAYCAAYAGPDLASAGAGLHIEDSTVIGRVWAQMIRLASNTIFHSRLGWRDPWQAAVWAVRRQTGCVRFCSLPFTSLTPRRYECLPPDKNSEAALEPRFITLRFGEPGYCLLSGDVPVAIWKGASDGSQMGVFHQIQETEAVTNVQIRSQEYLPANLERGIFLIPSRSVCAPVHADKVYGYGTRTGRCQGGADASDDVPSGIGIQLI
jgi:hypothetical protein